MQIRSRAYRSDFFFIAFSGAVEEREGYIVARTPSEPCWFWGNLLLFENPPRTGDCERWCALFAEEFACQPDTTHQTFGWDSPEGEPGQHQGFVDEGFVFEVTDVLVADEVAQPRYVHDGVELRLIESDDDWYQATENQVLCRMEGFTEEGYRRFKGKRMLQSRAMVEDGHGHWFGAFLDGRLVGDLGLFVEGDVARFQSVGTHPGFRRQGICSTLVHYACRFAQYKMGANSFVIAAEPDSSAGRIYRSVGFRPQEKQAGLCRWDRGQWNPPSRPPGGLE